jgi:hypothetical protein
MTRIRAPGQLQRASAWQVKLQFSQLERASKPEFKVDRYQGAPHDALG